MLSNIELLEELTKNLPNLDLMFHASNNVVNEIAYDVESGKCTANSLMNIDGIAVSNCIFAENTVLKRHNHEEKEWLLLYDGDLSVDIDGISSEDIERLMGNGDNFQLNIGDFIFVPSMVPHVVSSDGGAKLIAITIPSSVIYPKDANGK